MGTVERKAERGVTAQPDTPKPDCADGACESITWAYPGRRGDRVTGAPSARSTPPPPPGLDSADAGLLAGAPRRGVDRLGPRRPKSETPFSSPPAPQSSDFASRVLAGAPPTFCFVLVSGHPRRWPATPGPRELRPGASLRDGAAPPRRAWPALEAADRGLSSGFCTSL